MSGTAGNRKFAKAISLFALVLALAPGLRAQDAGRDSAVAVRVIELEKSWAAAQSRNDNAALNRFLDNSVVLVDAGGQLQGKPDYLAEVRAAGPQRTESTIETVTVHVSGNAAVAIGIYREKGMNGGQPYVVRRRFMDTWAFKAGSWVCVAGASRSLGRQESAH
jgi:ketosteroid isomerase-like protein